VISHKVGEQSMDDCISTLVTLLSAPPERVPPVVTVFAQPLQETTVQTIEKQVPEFALLLLFPAYRPKLTTRSLTLPKISPQVANQTHLFRRRAGEGIIMASRPF
jgi:hypothetical protein